MGGGPEDVWKNITSRSVSLPSHFPTLRSRGLSPFISFRDSCSISQSEDLVEVYNDQIEHSETSSTAQHLAQLSLDPLSNSSSSDTASNPSRTEQGDLAELLWSKSAVYLYPTAYTKDKIAGFLSVVRVKEERDQLRWKHLVSWIPEEMVQGTSDFDAYVLVELSSRMLKLPTSSTSSEFANLNLCRSPLLLNRTRTRCSRTSRTTHSKSFIFPSCLFASYTRLFPSSRRCLLFPSSTSNFNEMGRHYLNLALRRGYTPDAPFPGR